MDGDRFRGLMLNQPSKLKTVRLWDEITFVVAQGLPFPLLVTGKYLQERGNWTIRPCDKCGLSELLDAPSDLIRATFPQHPNAHLTEVFTQFCPLCGGVLSLKSVNRPEEDHEPETAPVPAPRAWWQFWR
ncbi:hypothetical protein [Aquisphaera giovannonii]|nr:hypothetical protein [Aquisphaera giovannonii]